MVFIKKVNNADAGDADHVGGNDWDLIDDYFDNVDITPKIAKINTETWIRDGKLKLRDSTNTYSQTVSAPALTANTSVTLPEVQPYTYFIYKSGSTYKGLNGLTGAVDQSNSDFKTVIQNIINAISPAGTPTIIRLGAGDFTLEAQLTIPSSRVGNITIKGQGIGKTNIIIGASFDAIALAPIFIGTSPSVVSGNLGTLTADTLVGSQTVTMSSGDVSKFSVGDYVLLRSDRSWVNPPTPVSVTKQGEIHKILAKPTSTTITLDSPAYDSYATADTSTLLRLTTITKNIKISDITIQSDASLDSGSTVGGFVLAYYNDALVLENIEIVNPIAQFDASMTMTSCINSKYLSCRVKLDPDHTYNLEYGLVFRGCCQNCIMSDCDTIGDLRHPFEYSTGSGNSGFEGPARNNTLNSCLAQGSHVAAFDSHADGENNTLINCKSLGTTNNSYGFLIRCPNTTLIGCSSQGSVDKGFYINENGHNCLLNGISVIGSTTQAIRIDEGIKNVTINGTFTRIKDQVIYISDGATHININNCIFDTCGTNNTSSEGIIECEDNITDLTIMGCDFSAGTAPANSRPFVINTGSIDGLIFSNNNVRGLTNKDPTITSGSTDVVIDNNLGQGVLSPAQITADQNDYAPTDIYASKTLRLDSDSSFRTITGLASGSHNRKLILQNISTNSILLANQNTGSSAANRFDFGGYDVPLLPSSQVELVYDNTSSRWRRSTNGSNIVIPSSSFGAFHNSERTAGDNVLALTAASGGTANTAVGDIKHPGIIQFTSGTSATGSGSVISTSNTLGLIYLGNSQYWRYDAVLSIDNLSDGTNTYVLRAGFIDTGTAESTDGAFFRYTHSVNSGKWELVARSNGTETVTNATNTAVAAATWYHLTVIVNPAGNKAEYFQDGTSLGTVTTNIPTGASRQTGFGMMFLKSAGTSDINFIKMDSLQLLGYFNTTR